MFQNMRFAGALAVGVSLAWLPWAAAGTGSRGVAVSSGFCAGGPTFENTGHYTINYSRGSGQTPASGSSRAAVGVPSGFQAGAPPLSNTGVYTVNYSRTRAYLNGWQQYLQALNGIRNQFTDAQWAQRMSELNDQFSRGLAARVGAP